MVAPPLQPVRWCPVSVMGDWRLHQPGCRASLPEDEPELVRRRFLELVVPTVRGLPVRAPPDERGSVPEPIALQVVVGDLDDPLDAKGLPGQVLPAVPARCRAGEPLPGRIGGLRPLRPFAPRMTVERALPQRLELLRERGSLVPRERRGHPD